MIAVACGKEDLELGNKTVYDTIRTTIYDTVRNFVTDTINVEKISYDTVRSFVTDTVRITINPDGTLSNTFWVKYVINQETGESDSVNIEDGKTVSLKSDVERLGYNFLYWNTQPDGNGSQFAAGENILVTKHIKFYAIWQNRDGLKSSELYEYLSKIDGTPTLDIKIVDISPDFSEINRALKAFWKIKVNMDLTDAIKVTSLGFGSFNDCTNLLSLKFPPNLQCIDHCFTGCSGLTKIEGIPSSVTKLEISNCKNLVSITIPENVTDLTIYDCPKLAALTIPNSVTTLGPLSGCSALTEITIPPSVKSMNIMGFYGCTNLKTVKHNLKECSQVSFQDCSSLTSITLPEFRDAIIRSSAFSGWRFCSFLITGIRFSS